ncbi:hypothetical protein E2C01_029671 [Portunus trituberculatus]|uniref:Uncharacterized protein n=1 Tax=Portunus trituberculatus TaxID=210409 RepID=A0A5B7EPY6_PORTR|nr:hypothetical protein [Portunus trituberculatus]
MDIGSVLQTKWTSWAMPATRVIQMITLPSSHPPVMGLVAKKAAQQLRESCIPPKSGPEGVLSHLTLHLTLDHRGTCQWISTQWTVPRSPFPPTSVSLTIIVASLGSTSVLNSSAVGEPWLSWHHLYLGLYSLALSHYAFTSSSRCQGRTPNNTVSTVCEGYPVVVMQDTLKAVLTPHSLC